MYPKKKSQRHFFFIVIYDHSYSLVRSLVIFQSQVNDSRGANGHVSHSGDEAALSAETNADGGKVLGSRTVVEVNVGSAEGGSKPEDVYSGSDEDTPHLHQSKIGGYKRPNECTDDATLTRHGKRSRADHDHERDRERDRERERSSPHDRDRAAPGAAERYRSGELDRDRERDHEEVCTSQVMMVGHIAQMSKSVTELSRYVVQAQEQVESVVATVGATSKESIAECVRQEVANQLASTNDAIAELKHLIVQLMNRFD